MKPFGLIGLKTLSTRGRVVFLTCLVAAYAHGAQAVEIMRWERMPLAVPLLVGQERIVFVDKNVRVGIPNNIKAILRVQSFGGAIYLKASEPIPPTRLQLQVSGTGEIILVDIAAQDPKEGQKQLEPVKIVPGEEASKHYGQSPTAVPQDAKNSDDEDEDAAPLSHETPIPVVLTRYAAQNLYAPLRTVETLDGVSKANLDKHLDLTSLLPTQPVQASALGAWKLENHYVTAVKLTNLSNQSISLDPRELQGDFATATFQHNTLGSRGNSADTTVVYLVTAGHDLGQSLLPKVSSVNAANNLGGHDEK